MEVKQFKRGATTIQKQNFEVDYDDNFKNAHKEESNDEDCSKKKLKRFFTVDVSTVIDKQF